MKLTKEQLLVAKNAKNTEELAALAKEFGVEMSAEDLQKTFDTLQKAGELADEELNNVAGGSCNPLHVFFGTDHPDEVCPSCGHVGMHEAVGSDLSSYYECENCLKAFEKTSSGSLRFSHSIDVSGEI